MLVPNSITLAVGTTNTTPANRILIANALCNRWVRGVHVTNTTAASIDLSAGMGAAAILTAANSSFGFAAPVPAKMTEYPLAQYGGQGRKGLGAGSLNELMAHASATGLLITFLYSDDTLG